MSNQETSRVGSGPAWSGARDEALSRLDEFLPEVSHYTARRNYARAGNIGVSRLSPYLRYRLISEQEVLGRVLSVTEFSTAEKFIQEVVWRTYWKGALHRSPGIWRSFQDRTRALAAQVDSAPWSDLYRAAQAGQTHLVYFNEWVQELISTGYLHNHVRMWFASIWIFTFKIPWQLGAAFMYHHLLDGDPASNTLSWRWVAGLHTKGKTYLARADNIATYSEGRWNPKVGELAAEPFRVEEEYCETLGEAHTGPPCSDGGCAGLVVTTDDLSLETVHDVRPYAALCIYHPRDAELTPIKQLFLEQATEDFRGRLSALRGGAVPVIATSPAELAAWHARENVKGVCIAAPQVGPLIEPLASFASSLESADVTVQMLLREWDSALFPLCDKGFFTMWERFKKRWERGALCR